MLPSQVCAPLGGGGSAVTSWASAGSTIAQQNQSFDGDLSTFASFRYPAAGVVSFHGTAQTGTVRPAGDIAGIAISQPAADQDIQVLVTTYLHGARQQSGLAGIQTGNGSQICAGSCENRNRITFFGITAMAPFDAIEAALSVSGLAGAVEIRELCSQ